MAKEVCAHCAKAPPVWLVADSRWHRYHEVKGDKVRTRRQQDGYLLCETCKKQVEKQNRRRPRELRFIRWE